MLKSTGNLINKMRSSSYSNNVLGRAICFSTWLDLQVKDGQRVWSRNSILKFFPPIESLKTFLVKEHILLRHYVAICVRLCHYLAQRDCTIRLPPPTKDAFS